MIWGRSPQACPTSKQEFSVSVSATEQKWTVVPDFEGGLETVFCEDGGPLRVLGGGR